MAKFCFILIEGLEMAKFCFRPKVENISSINSAPHAWLCFTKGQKFGLFQIKGGYLDFSHLTELKNIYITEIYMKKQFKSIITKNHKIKKIDIFDGVPLKGYVAS